MKQCYLFVMMPMVWLFMVGAAIPLAAQQLPAVKGIVKSETDAALSHVTVEVRNKKGDFSAHTFTDDAGVFTFNNLESGDSYSFTFTHLGYAKKVLEGYSYKAGEMITLSVQLSTAIKDINPVVVTALGIKREAKALSYSHQSVDVNSLNETKDPNFINSLAGKVAGVQIVPSGFNTGSGRIVIRGNKSLTGNNQPLFVVDGMPIENTPGDDGSIDYGSGAADINPADIESMEVLKGPNAAALYGSRGQNGVILITTKKGSGKFKVTLNSNETFQTLTEFPEYQNAYGVGTSFYIDNTHRIPVGNVNYRSWGSPMLGQPYVAINGEIKPYLPQPDNVKDFYSTAHLFTNSIAIEGGNTNTTYRIGYTNYTGTSVVDGFNKDNKHSIDVRMTNTFTKWFTMDSKVSFIRDIVHNRQYSNSNGRNPTYEYVHMARSTDLDELLPYEDPVTGHEIGTHRNFSNPYWIVNKNPNQDTKDRVIASFNPQINLTPWLKFTGRLGADMIWWSGSEFNDIGSVIASNPDGFLRTFNTNQTNFNLEGLFSFNKRVRNFSISAVAGATRYTSNYETRDTRINSLLQPGLINVSNAKEYPINGQTARKKVTNSVYGAVSVGYNDFAFIDLTGRNDWSSTLPAANRAYFYPSIGGSLILTDMLHINSNVLNYAKVRASMAIVGNDTDPYRLDQAYSFNGLFNGSPIASLSTTMNNPDLKPEKTRSYEYGAELRLFNNRIFIDATHYSASTTDQIITAQVPASSGYKQRIYNAGEIRNWGNELMVTAKILTGKKFNWETQINFSKNNSLVVSLIDSVNRFVLNNNSSYIYVYAEVGKPYGYMRGLGVARDASGHMLLDDGGGLLTKNPDMAFGSSSPDWLGSLRNTFNYGNFSLSILLDVRSGGLLYSGSYSQMLTNGVLAETLNGRDDYYKHSMIFGESAGELTGGAQWDAYYADGTKNTKYVTPQNYEYARPNYAEFVMFDASFVKLRELALGYSFPEKLIGRTPIKTARLSLVGRNLAILYRNTPRGIDPEATSSAGNGQGIERGSLPPNAIYGFNINLTF
ncbi:SusC/RagA family TonB-linked outer membrane protein [Chitinophaga agrisoli]|uniref:SusC/RagA family TonB-linked outer membrane protein n=1 Tax=Chitinophaga agrisoli TaxID=2607653 RepID=A0A5B2VQN1_9BACT|nr:SusC/RagA family TonB-linked outer membrane protein [Chitinophaga agrisoli]KAA2240686.1 SusC/RagA family TonB-linked outer membrane protein [Chitinophaga agrisoli]